jgi:hypothetical protein
MSRIFLALPLVAALALVGCDEATSSSSSKQPAVDTSKTGTGTGTGTGSGTGTGTGTGTGAGTGTCDGYKGLWLMDSTISQGGLTLTFRSEMTLTATTFATNGYKGMGTAPSLVYQASGEIKAISGARLVGKATTVMELDVKTGAMVPSTDPNNFTSDTLQYSFPSAGKMRLLELNAPETEAVTWTCS